MNIVATMVANVALMTVVGSLASYATAALVGKLLG